MTIMTLSWRSGLVGETRSMMEDCGEGKNGSRCCILWVWPRSLFLPLFSPALCALFPPLSLFFNWFFYYVQPYYIIISYYTIITIYLFTNSILIPLHLILFHTLRLHPYLSVRYYSRLLPLLFSPSSEHFFLSPSSLLFVCNCYWVI